MITEIVLIGTFWLVAAICILLSNPTGDDELTGEPMGIQQWEYPFLSGFAFGPLLMLIGSVI